MKYAMKMITKLLIILLAVVVCLPWMAIEYTLAAVLYIILAFFEFLMEMVETSEEIRRKMLKKLMEMNDKE